MILGSEPLTTTLGLLWWEKRWHHFWSLWRTVALSLSKNIDSFIGNEPWIRSGTWILPLGCQLLNIWPWSRNITLNPVSSSMYSVEWHVLCLLHGVDNWTWRCFCICCSFCAWWLFLQAAWCGPSSVHCSDICMSPFSPEGLDRLHSFITLIRIFEYQLCARHCVIHCFFIWCLAHSKYWVNSG